MNRNENELVGLSRGRLDTVECGDSKFFLCRKLKPDSTEIYTVGQSQHFLKCVT